MSRPVPTLSAAGWKETVSEKADALMANYIVSENLQSFIYKDTVTSLSTHIKEYGNNPNELQRVVNSDLITYLSRYFDMVEVEVIVPNVDDKSPDVKNLTISATVSQNGLRYDLAQKIETINDRVSRVFDLNNNGVINEF